MGRPREPSPGIWESALGPPASRRRWTFVAVERRELVAPATWCSPHAKRVKKRTAREDARPTDQGRSEHPFGIQETPKFYSELDLRSACYLLVPFAGQSDEFSAFRLRESD